MYNDPTEDIDFIESFWSDASSIDVANLEALLEAANIVCVAYAPALADGVSVPMNYRLAEIMQAKHIFGQLRGGNNESFGPDGYAVTPYPLIFAAQSMLRPKLSPLKRLR